jgi:hypothetical protein
LRIRTISIRPRLFGPAGLLGVRFLIEINGDRPPLIQGRRPE